MEEYKQEPIKQQDDRHQKFESIFSTNEVNPSLNKTEDRSVDFASQGDEDWTFAKDYQTLSESQITPTSIEHNFNDGSDDVFIKSKKKKSSSFFTVSIILLLFFVAWNVLAGIWLTTGVLDGKDAVYRAQDAVTVLNFDKVMSELTLSKRAFVRAQRGAWMLRWTYPIPWLGEQIRGVNYIIDAGAKVLIVVEDVAELGFELMSIVEDAEVLNSDNNLHSESSFDDISPVMKADLLRALHNATPNLHKMRAKIYIAQKELEDLRNLDVHPFLIESVEPLEEVMPLLVSGIDFITPFAATVGELAGVDADKQWLILFLNNTELRPGGGFIGVYALMLNRDGEIVNLQTDDSYKVDLLVEGDPEWNVEPPKPFTEFFGLKNWYFRDSNWSPDFAGSAVLSSTMFRNQFSQAGQPIPEIHGVIGFTPTLVEGLLEIIGPITVDGIEFTSDNIVEELEYQVEFAYAVNGVGKTARKNIVSDLTDAVIDRIMSSSIKTWAEILEMIMLDFDEKQIAMYSFDEDTQNAFEDFGWSGVLDITDTDDVLMVVDSNTVSLKTDPFVNRYIDYSIVKGSDGYIANVDVTYEHVGNYAPTVSKYLTYTRIYTPKGSELLTYSDTVFGIEIEEDLGMTSIGGYIEIYPGETKTLSYTYRLPKSVKKAIDKGVYELTVFKQIGAANHALTLDLDFGKNIRVASPAEDEQFWGDDSYNTNTILDQDLVFTVEL